MEDVIDIISYLLDHLDDEDDEMVEERLRAVGFPDDDIQRALDWMEGFAVEAQEDTNPRSLRAYHPYEQQNLSVAARGQLHDLERLGVINGAMRERIIDRLLALGLDDTDLETLDWVTFMVMANDPGPEAFWVDALLGADGARILH
ncbi:MAG: Smg family protein [Acidithiobacillus ferrivorans]